MHECSARGRAAYYAADRFAYARMKSHRGDSTVSALSALPAQRSFFFVIGFWLRGNQPFSMRRGVTATRLQVPFCYMSRTTVPLVLRCSTLKKPYPEKGKTNLSHDGLNPAHVPFIRVNNPTFKPSCELVIGRADIEGSKSDVASDAWPPRASYPCGNFSDTSHVKRQHLKGSIGQHFC